MATYTIETITELSEAESYFFGNGYETPQDWDRLCEESKKYLIDKATKDREVGGFEPLDAPLSWEQIKHGWRYQFMSYAGPRQQDFPEEGDHFLRLVKKDGYLVQIACGFVTPEGQFNLCDAVMGNDQSGSRAWWYSYEFQKVNVDFMKSMGATTFKVNFAKDSYMKEQWKLWDQAILSKFGEAKFTDVKQDIHTYQRADLDGKISRYVVEQYFLEYDIYDEYLPE